MPRIGLSGASAAQGHARIMMTYASTTAGNIRNDEFDHEPPPPEPRERQVNGNCEASVDHQQQAYNAHGERGAGQQTERCNIERTGRGKRSRDADQEQRRPHHRGGKWNVLGMVERGAVPGPADAQPDCGEEGRTRASDQSRRRRRRTDPANADQRTQDVT